MRKLTGLIAALFICSTTYVPAAQAQNDTPSKEQQIAAAVSAAPPNKQEGAKVYGYTRQGKLTTLREGSNELICLADNPGDARFHVACYYKELDPFMKRGRELRAEGLSRMEVDSIRKVEIEAGELHYPEKPMGLYSLSGPQDGFNYETGEVEKADPLYVVYVPYATEESTGISSTPAGEGGSWLMEPGTPWSHIMIPGRSIEPETAGN
ncbi:hypothetical protein ACG2F4_01550 [Halalkalibaculum sp. DA3122]|uniref:hypothetical protein n=1 Tax=unclassified Halalkalibaculum TaxID=2964617 RepID=UPI0037549D6F